MNFLFVGIGSIAKRHIRNLRELCGNRIHITALRRGGRDTASSVLMPIDRVVYSKDELERQYDAIFITNPTSEHYGTLEALLPYSDHFFIEKPVFRTGEEDLQRFILPSKKYYVASPLRYTNVIQYLKENVDFSRIYAMCCISSSYLPDWRPGTDYRTTYSAHRELGGGVSIDLIHEWDYINYLIGRPRELKSIVGKKSELEINSDDVAVYIADYPGMVVEVHLDYFGREPIRRITLFGRDDTITADLISQRIEWLSSRKAVHLAQPRDDYQKKELLHFLNMVRYDRSSDNDLPEACRVLRLTKGIL